jgi:hypothetical protein
MGSVWSIAYKLSHEAPKSNESGSGALDQPASAHDHTLYYCGLSTWKLEPCTYSDDEIVSALIVGVGFVLLVCVGIWACQPLEHRAARRLRRRAAYAELEVPRRAVPVVQPVYTVPAPPPPPPPAQRVVYTQPQYVVTGAGAGVGLGEGAPSVLHCDIQSLLQSR